MSAQRYRKKPVEVEAEQFTKDMITLPKGVYYNRRNPNQFFIDTIEGPLNVADGDWIITGVKGERYPCRHDIFELTYDKVD